MHNTLTDSDLLAIWPDHAPTPLAEAPALASKAGIGQLLLKLETRRPFGNFKALGGTIAGLRAIARAVGALDIVQLLANPGRYGPCPTLLCASDGNHGLSVAAAAHRAGASARIYLPAAVRDDRADRIEALGAEVVRVPGTYDDAVSIAATAAAAGAGLLIPDTTQDPNHPVVADVMAGYQVIAREIRSELRRRSQPLPTHQFIQAGVGGLASAMADGLGSGRSGGPRIVVVEPSTAACVAHALILGRAERIDGGLETSAEMLSCGLASVPALRRLIHHHARSLLVDEADLLRAEAALTASAIDSTASGAAGLAGLLIAATDPIERKRLGLSDASRVLLVISERRP
ncbi:pyridoxal-phosphate dependent enzyme [Sphingomonas gei]|uniref:Pyridoxal-phosphate dependent enzyme n=1 Tax=Sphingomonas gei TaxID=1395960 RepID=A0A4S1X922_9SPHN|nr:pyridoxal-phosphate dependent enzyme [Sphingomonas gei]TGX52253.1 pyridoxal-phosphate dependent enzyme [Sphingomonas gei]